jgi:hypothetical protein
MNDNTDKLIQAECVQATAKLLSQYWADIQTVLSGSENTVAVSVVYDIDVGGAFPEVTTKLSFSLGKIKDERQTVIDPSQMTLSGIMP